ncbi:DUF6435 family protein [Enterovibrio sp. 27052020O]|uniref:DUF6435 family protein n=1 Tax=Enterovibrio sp. 27052020O TaxID=3241166 RepID=UPI00388FB0DA
MFSLFKKDPTKKLRVKYNATLERAMQAQRNGDMHSYAFITSEAEALWKEIERIESETK